MALTYSHYGPRVRRVGPSWPTHVGAAGFAYQRPAILVLLGNRPSNADDVARRLADMGFGPASTAKVPYVLRTMQREGLVRFTWDATPTQSPGPVYSATDLGHEYLAEVTPILIEHRDALSAMVNRFQDRELHRGGQPKR